MTDSMIRRVAEAMDKENERNPACDWNKLAAVGLSAALWVDGVDEQLVIEAGSAVGVDPVTVAECWDAMINAALEEGE